MDKHYLTPAERHKLNCWLEAALPSIETQRISKAKAATMASGELGFRVTPGHLHSAAAALDLDAWPASREAKVDRVALLAETMLELWPGANNETRNAVSVPGSRLWLTTTKFSPSVCQVVLVITGAL